jgi:hypothetical protein
MPVKSTLALDAEAIRKLERGAARWVISKAEALRRAIDLPARQQETPAASRLEALEELQRSLKLSPAQARKWSRQVREARAESSARVNWLHEMAHRFPRRGGV